MSSREKKGSRQPQQQQASAKIAMDNPVVLAFNPFASQGVDWYGNSRLHSLIGSVEYNSPHCIRLVQSLTSEYPLAVSSVNQFGRLPLHYSLDRLGRKLNLEVIRFLLAAFPSGATQRDRDGLNAMDLCRYWGHPKSVLLLVAGAAPEAYSRELHEIKFGSVIAIFLDALLVFSRRGRSHEDDGTQNDDLLWTDTSETANSSDLTTRMDSSLEATPPPISMESPPQWSDSSLTLD